VVAVNLGSDHVTVSWTQAAEVLVRHSDLGVEGVWTLTRAAQHALLTLALDARRDSDLSLTLASMDLGEVLEELEWADPDLPGRAATVDLGPTPSGGDGGCRAAVAVLLAGCLDTAACLLRDPCGEMDTAEVLRLARMVHLLDAAHLRVTGRMP